MTLREITLKIHNALMIIIYHSTYLFENPHILSKINPDKMVLYQESSRFFVVAVRPLIIEGFKMKTNC